MKRIAIFASGEGSNAENIIRYFKDKKTAEVSIVVSNKADAPVLSKAQDLGVPVAVVDKKQIFASSDFLRNLTELKIDLIVLAGFLWQIPDLLIEAFPDRIINIHPSLLPKYGGKGMYGENVHKAVLINQDEEAGITIHFVNEHYDQGKIIFQKSIAVSTDDNVKSLSEKVHRLEHKYFPEVIERVLEG